MELTKQELEEFKVESFELLDLAESNLLTYDSSGDYQTTYTHLFRAFHSLKGSCGMMGLTQLQDLLHKLEDLLVKTKDVSIIEKAQIETFLEGIDKAKALFHKLNSENLSSANTISATEISETTAIKEEPVILSEAVLEFVFEAIEISQRISKILQSFEKNQQSDSDIDSLYRDVHTLKGSAYLFEFKQLGELGHALESSLEPIRTQKVTPHPSLVDHLFRCLDLIDRMINEIGHGRSLSPFDDEVNKCTITLNLMERGQFNVVSDSSTEKSNMPKQNVTPEATPKVSSPTTNTTAQSPSNSSTPPAGNSESTDKDSSSSVRVPVALLDKLMTLMGEMVLVRNQVIQYSNRTDDLEFLNLSQRLNVVTTEIQGEMMKTRMQPIGNVLSKFTRVVRDLSKELNKKIDIQLSGNETELDKTLLEAVKDPLTHIIRNSCDHGIESPADRKAKGKPETGLIQVKSYHEGGQVIVEVQDDGGGLNKDKIIAKALEKQIITSERAKTMSDREIYNLIFAPGFSTASKVSNVSGRGVGMDVVRTNIEKIGGTVDLSSELDYGTSIKLRIPLTLAIVPALIVKSADESFAIPQLKLVELVRVEKNSETQLEFIQGNPVYRLRGKILPLISLNKALDLKTSFIPEATNIIVLKSDDYVFGLIVDEVHDTADIVVKPLSRFLKTIDTYSGATVLGDGSVALILDVAGLAKHQLALVDNNQSIDRAQNQMDQAQQKSMDEIQDFLLVKLASQVKHAILLNYVHRLEEFKSTEFETTAHKTIVRYRGGVLPIISINDTLDLRMENQKTQEAYPVVVIEKAGKLFGLKVDEILDVLKTEKALDTSITEENGIIGNLVTDTEVITVIDPYKVINLFLKTDVNDKLENYFDQKRASTRVAKESLPPQREKILFVDDTVFFRRHVSKELEKAGYEVTTAKDGQEALQILESQQHQFNLVLSDIEMPIMNGFGLAKNVRKNPKLKHLPLIALSTRADESYVQKGIESGFDLYLEKMNVEQVLNSISKLKLKESA